MLVSTAAGIDCGGCESRQALRQMGRDLVVFGQSVAVAEGDPGGRRQDPDLAHAATEPLAQIPALGHQVDRPTEDRSHRGSQSFGEAELHGVGSGGVA